jgi:hypothetical protein
MKNAQILSKCFLSQIAYQQAQINDRKTKSFQVFLNKST